MRATFPQANLRAFTLVEILVSTAVFSILMISLVQLLAATQKTWSNARSHLSQFREARDAFTTVTRRLNDCTLNPYWDFEYPGGDKTKTPLRYTRSSELHFLCGPTDPSYSISGSSVIPSAPTTAGHSYHTHGIFFQAPFGHHDEVDLDGNGVDDWVDFNTLLNAWGYYIEYGDDSAGRPPHTASLPARWRFRLMEMRDPAQNLAIYNPAATTPWQEAALPNSHQIAENVIALIISPQEEANAAAAAGRTSPTAIAPAYTYDSSDASVPLTHHNLPPLIRVTMVVLDEVSAARLALLTTGNAAPDFGIASNNWFTDATNFDTDLIALEAELDNQGLRFRVFSSTVRLRNAKWSF